MNTADTSIADFEGAMALLLLHPDFDEMYHYDELENDRRTEYFFGATKTPHGDAVTIKVNIRLYKNAYEISSNAWADRKYRTINKKGYRRFLYFFNKVWDVYQARANATAYGWERRA